MFKKIVFLLIVFQFSSVFSQKETKSYKDSIVKYLYNNPDKAIQLSHKFLNVIENTDRIDDKVLSYSILGIAYEIKNSIDSTLYYYQKCLNIVDKPKDIIQYKYSIGVIYENEFNYKDALQLYDQALKIAKKENDEYFIYEVKSAIASIKSKIGQSEEALILIREVYDRNKQTNNNNLKFNRKTLIETCLNIKKTAEADGLIDEGLREALKTNNYEFQYYLYKLKSESEFLQNKFDAAEKSAKKALEKAKKLSNDEFIDEAHYTLVKASCSKGNYNNTITVLNEIINNKREKTIGQNSKYFKLLAYAYKQTNNEPLSNIFYQKYILEEEKVNKKRLSTLERIHSITLKNQVSDIEKTYEFELKEEISKKDKQKKNKSLWIIAFISLFIIGLFIILKFKINEKQNQTRFDNLMIKIKDYEANSLVLKEKDKKDDNDEKEQKEPIVVSKKETLVDKEENYTTLEKDDDVENIIDTEFNTDTGFNIDDEKVKEILEKIEKLEDRKYYLRQDCTMHNMAKRLKTNTSYLSKIINSHLNKSFSTYINELRVNYAILELKNNKRLRSYSVKGIAQELGYKNADAFTKYFKAATGITPSVYIKKIEAL